MSKLIIQIPCLNEASTLPATIRDLPRDVPGVDAVEVLVIDDGSTDDTSAVARACGVDHVIRFRSHKGLAAAFMAGLDACIKQGADYIVNTDADNQYAAREIPRLVQPLLAGKADIVIGDRNIRALQTMPRVKRWLQLIGSWVVRQVSNTRIPDTTSGFRAGRGDSCPLGFETDQTVVGRTENLASLTGLRGDRQMPDALKNPPKTGFWRHTESSIRTHEAQLFTLGVIGEYLARMHYRMMAKPAYVVRAAVLVGGTTPVAPRAPAAS